MQASSSSKGLLICGSIPAMYPCTRVPLPALLSIVTKHLLSFAAAHKQTNKSYSSCCGKLLLTVDDCPLYVAQWVTVEKCHKAEDFVKIDKLLINLQLESLLVQVLLTFFADLQHLLMQPKWLPIVSLCFGFMKPALRHLKAGFGFLTLKKPGFAFGF